MFRACAIFLHESWFVRRLLSNDPVNGAFLVTDGPAEPATKIVMKVTRPQEKKAELEAEGYTDFTVVERMYMEGEAVYREEIPEKTHYFCIMIARKV